MSDRILNTPLGDIIFFCLVSSLQYGFYFNPLSTKPPKWSNTLKQFVSFLQTNFLNVFDHFVGLALKGLRTYCRYNKSC